MKFTNSHYLGGNLVGIGKVRTTGEVEFKFLDKPIHNKIVSTGLDNMLTANNSTTAASQWLNGDYPHFYIRGSGSGYYFGPGSGTFYGPFAFVSLGTGDTATTFLDTDLASGLGTYSSTVYAPSTGAENGFNGTRINNYGNYSFRMSYQTEAVTEDTVVKEVGFFGKTTSGAYPLTARVVLDSPIELKNGEYLILTYQLEWVFGNSTETAVNDFCGLKDSNGDTLKAACKLYALHTVNGTWGNVLQNLPYITTSGTESTNTSTGAGYIASYMHPAMGCSSTEGDAYNRQYVYVGYSTSSTLALPADSEGLGLTCASGGASTVGNTTSHWPTTYTCVDKTYKYRDILFTFGTFAPRMVGNPEAYTDIYFLRFRGINYRFGYNDNGTWVPQALRKYANQTLQLCHRTQLVTEDTTDIPAE